MCHLFHTSLSRGDSLFQVYQVYQVYQILLANSKGSIDKVQEVC